VRHTVVRVPCWFTTAQALRVAHLKGAEHLLVERGGSWGSVSRRALEMAPATDTVARWTCGGAPTADAATPVRVARRLLAATDAACLWVVQAGIVVGAVSAEDLAGEEAAPAAHAAQGSSREAA
jgi:hypothetical protein